MMMLTSQICRFTHEKRCFVRKPGLKAKEANEKMKKGTENTHDCQRESTLKVNSEQSRAKHMLTEI